MNEDEVFFRALAERAVEKTADKAIDKRPRIPGEKDRRGLNPGLILAPAAAQAFDAYSTREGMKAGGREGNPAMSPFADNEAALYGSKVGAGLLIGFLANKLAKAGHRNAAKLLSGVSIAVPVGAGIHNLQLAEKGKP